MGLPLTSYAEVFIHSFQCEMKGLLIHIRLHFQLVVISFLSPNHRNSSYNFSIMAKNLRIDQRITGMNLVKNYSCLTSFLYLHSFIISNRSIVPF